MLVLLSQSISQLLSTAAFGSSSSSSSSSKQAHRCVMASALYVTGVLTAFCCRCVCVLLTIHVQACVGETTLRRLCESQQAHTLAQPITCKVHLQQVVSHARTHTHTHTQCAHPARLPPVAFLGEPPLGNIIGCSPRQAKASVPKAGILNQSWWPYSGSAVEIFGARVWQCRRCCCSCQWPVTH